MNKAYQLQKNYSKKNVYAPLPHMNQEGALFSL